MPEQKKERSDAVLGQSASGESEITRSEAVGDGTRTEDALLKLMGYEERYGLWRDPDGNRLDGGRFQALDEACATVETEDWEAGPVDRS